MGIAELRRLRVLEEENRKLKQLVADLSLDKQMLQNAKEKVEAWRVEYDNSRPYGALGNVSPREFAVVAGAVG